jgi:metal-sulfur cluster biosynthetic enzyme
MTARMAPSESSIRDALRQVDDPEAGFNIVDLGLVYRIDVEPASVHIELTMTTAACPMTDMIIADVRAAVAPIVPPGIAAHIEMVWEPPWTPERMSSAAREHFGWPS